MFQMEERYWKLREECENAINRYVVDPCESNLSAYKEALNAYQEICMYILEWLLNENADVLKRLKNCS